MGKGGRIYGSRVSVNFGKGDQIYGTRLLWAQSDH